MAGLSRGLLLLLLLLARPTAAAPAATLTLEAYWQLVADTRAALAAPDSSADETQRQIRHQLADRWQALQAVILPDGRQVPVEATFIVAGLRAEPASPERLRALLAALEEAGRNWPPPGHDHDDLAPLHTILAAPEFDWPEEQPSYWEQLQERIGRRFWAWVDSWLPQGSGGGFFGLGTLISLIGAAVLLLVLAYAWRGLFGGLVTEATLEGEGADGQELMTADSALKQARDLSNAGDYRTAVRYLYLSALLLLEEHDLLRHDRSQTNREYLRSVAHRPELLRPLGEIVDVFDRVWYGYQPIDETVYNHYRRHIEALRRAASGS